MKKNDSKKMSVKSAKSKTSTTVESLNDKEMANNNMIQAIDILNKKGYPAEYCSSDSNMRNTPYIRFGDKISDFTFAKTPFESNLDMLEGNLIIKLTCEVENNHIAELFENSRLLLNWAKNLEEACTLFCEIDVPFGEDPDEFFYSEVSDEFFVEELDYDGPFDVEEGEGPEYTLTFFMIVSPQMKENIINDIRVFGETHGIIATVSTWEEL